MQKVYNIKNLVFFNTCDTDPKSYVRLRVHVCVHIMHIYIYTHINIFC